MEFGTMAQWAGAVATLLAVCVALFKDEILKWRRKPKLALNVALAPPDCHKTTLSYKVQRTALTFVTAECYYLRLWVKNEGKTRAETVQVFAEKLCRRSADGQFKPVENFIPMNLRWAYSHANGRPPEIFADGISPGMGKHCDLGCVVDPARRKDLGDDLPGVQAQETILKLDVEFPPNTMSHLIAPGVYRLHLLLAAANCAPVATQLEITLTGKWSSDERLMFSDGLGITVISQ